MKVYLTIQTFHFKYFVNMICRHLHDDRKPLFFSMFIKTSYFNNHCCKWLSRNLKYRISRKHNAHTTNALMKEQ